MMWTLRAHPDWHRRELRCQSEDHEIEEVRDHVLDHGAAEQ